MKKYLVAGAIICCIASLFVSHSETYFDIIGGSRQIRSYIFNFKIHQYDKDTIFSSIVRKYYKYEIPHDWRLERKGDIRATIDCYNPIFSYLLNIGALLNHKSPEYQKIAINDLINFLKSNKVTTHELKMIVNQLQTAEKYSGLGLL